MKELSPRSPASNRPSVPAAVGTPGALSFPVLKDYWALTKPEISLLVTISALAGFLLGSPAGVDAWTLAVALVGIALTSGGACVLNHYLERDLDGQMKRTAARPLPAGRVSARRARNLGLGLVMAGVGLVCPLVNPLTAVLAVLTVVLYLYVYTPLKQKTKYNTLLGTIPGALPALGGWTAATNDLTLGGWTIFAILAVWQMPHFLSLAWMYRKDYGRARYAMLPGVEPDGRSTVRQALFFGVLLLLVGTTPTLVGVAGPVYLAGAIALGLWFLRPIVAFYRTRSQQDARRVLKASVLYILVLVGLVLVDWLVR
jgi:protoheme IX farnesyltransferase